MSLSFKLWLNITIIFGWVMRFLKLILETRTKDIDIVKV